MKSTYFWVGPDLRIESIDIYNTYFRQGFLVHLGAIWHNTPVSVSVRVTDPARSKVVIKFEKLGNSSASLHSPEIHKFVCLFLHCENIAVFFS